MSENPPSSPPKSVAALGEALAALSAQPAKVEEQPPEATLAQILEQMPLFVGRTVKRLIYHVENTLYYPDNLQLHCENAKCLGVRRHALLGAGGRPVRFVARTGAPAFHYCGYICVNCGIDVRIFGLRTTSGTGQGGTCGKIYEFPSFGTPIPPKFFAVIGESNRNHFLNARRSIARGLGIGAFAYFRRIVEGEKLNLISSVLKVAEATNAPAAQIKLLGKAAHERQFSKAMKMLRKASAIPAMLLIDGENPLAVLHDVLSDGIHNLSEEDCLNRAIHAETILCELVVRMNSAVTGNAAVAEAMKKVRKSGTA